jgi:hypothetical protein
MHLASPTRPAQVAVSSDVKKRECFSILLARMRVRDSGHGARFPERR